MTTQGTTGELPRVEDYRADLSPYAIQGMRMRRDPLKFFEYTNFYTRVNPPPAEPLPPLHPLGFWSLTMYNESFLLVDNPIDRYIIRPDQPGLTFGPDGSLTLYMQADKPVEVPEGNWLPAPEGAFSVTLRTYLPQKAIQDGTWFPPQIERV